MKKKLSVALLAIYSVFIAGLGFHVTGAFFTDSSNSTTNAFTAAATFPTATPTPTGTPPTGIATHVVISEVQINGTNANQDFVELYNPTGSSIIITGWKLRVRNSAGTEDSLAVLPTASISAHGFYLWSNNQSGFNTSIGADTSNTNNISPNNSIALLTNLDSIVDQVAWGSSTNPFIEGSAVTLDFTSGGSIERKALSSSDATSMTSGADVSKGNGFDSDNNATDFILRTTAQPQNSTSGTEQP
ncbi:MAG: lamin tail domain-containing protein [Candidatus Levybacteria bacterium]|nr:lamin tail domain-containing protein [Candidatus Levybacteria bacterium]